MIKIFLSPFSQKGEDEINEFIENTNVDKFFMNESSIMVVYHKEKPRVP